VDPQGGTQYSRYERVRVERVFTNAIQKEDGLREASRLATGPPRFTMNCLNAQALGSLLDVKNSHSRLEVISEKVSKVSPQESASLDGFDESSMEVKAQRHAEKIPSRRTDLPTTRAQEIGWLLSGPASHGYIQHRRRKKGLLADGEAASSSSPASPSGFLQHSSSAPSLSAPEPHVPLGKNLKAVHDLNNRRFYRPKTFCPITKYADTYMSLMHHDPFHQSATR